MYDVELKRKWDRANILAYAREQGKKEGLAEGEVKKNYEFVSNLLEAKRFSVEEIAKYANVPVRQLVTPMPTRSQPQGPARALRDSETAFSASAWPYGYLCGSALPGA